MSETLTILSDHDALHNREGYVAHKRSGFFHLFESGATNMDPHLCYVGYQRFVEPGVTNREWRSCWRFPLDPLDWSRVLAVKLRWYPIEKQIYIGHEITDGRLRLRFRYKTDGNLWSLVVPGPTDYNPPGLTLLEAVLEPDEWYAGMFGEQVTYQLDPDDAETVIKAATGSHLYFQPRVEFMPLPGNTGFRTVLSSGGEDKEYQRPALILVLEDQIDIKEARERIYQRFEDLWIGDAAVTYENEKFKPPATGSWARLAVRHTGQATQETMGPPGSRLFVRRGKVFIQCFVPVDRGKQAADALALAVKQTFEGADLGGLRFFDSEVRPVGLDGRWYQSNVVTGFSYDEVK